MAFGTFDLLHPGHEHFLKQAKRYGDLIVVIARDNTVLKVKGKKTEIQAQGDYITLLTQHFIYESLKDIELRSEIITLINPILIHGMFDRDIRNFFNEVFKYLQEFGIVDQQNKTIIKNLFYFYSAQKYFGGAESKETARFCFGWGRWLQFSARRNIFQIL